ncbi:JDVT-CTERM system glutamic-type intramembrane protease MrtJ [Marinobacter sp.]|uniref:JDVT-CTERM system glutamic-type intramembrane protease MrtJ n=1 Tax=Marinobacter sp. TaxID=50741 RepID=UPI003565D07C
MHESTSLRAQLGLIAPKRLMSDWQFLLALMAGCLVSVVLTAFFDGSGWQDANLLAILSLILWAPVIEELAFRGVVQGWLSGNSWGKRGFAGLSCANLIAALLFSAWHLVYRADLIAWLVFIPALVFGYFRDRHGSLVPCVILHAAYNAALLPGWYFLS